MKNEKWFESDGKIIRQKTTDPNAALERARLLRDADKGNFGESRLIGSIDTHVLEKEVKAAGLKFSDRDAVRDLIKRKLLSGDWDKFRVWKGSY